MSRAAGAFFRRDAIYIISSSESTGGMWLSVGPVFKVPRDAEAPTLGQAALDALNASRRNVPVPDDLTGKEMLEPFGFKNRSVLTKGAKYVVVVVVGDGPSVTVTPTRSTKGGYLHMSDRALSVQPDAMEVGQALLDAEAHSA